MATGAGRPAILISRHAARAASASSRGAGPTSTRTPRTRPCSGRSCSSAWLGTQGLDLPHHRRSIDEAPARGRPDLRVVSNVAVGYNNIDVAAGTRRGRRGHQYAGRPHRHHRRLRLGPAHGDGPARWSRPTATCARAGSRQWEYMLLLGGDVHGKTLGVVGFGRIGRAVARRALGFGMRVLYQDAVPADPATERELNATRVDLADPAARVRLRDPPHPAPPRDAPPDQRRVAPRHEEDRVPGQRRARPGGRRGGAGAGPHARAGSPARGSTSSRRSPRCTRASSA